MKILLIEDKPADARLLKEMLVDSSIKDAFSIVNVRRLDEALERAGKEEFDIILLDLMLPDSFGFDTFLRVRERASNVPIVVLSGLSDEVMAASAVRQGAQDYLVKGQVDSNILVRAIRYAIERQHADKTKDHGSWSEYRDMLGISASFKEVRDIVNVVAKTSNTSVLIQGETGTGKGIVANAIHHLSNRRNKPFIELNCSSIPGTLLEAEMFGYEKGAFTDAKSSKKGLLELAHGGSIFFDEIGDMDVMIQPKLLSFLENRRFRRVGGLNDIKVDVRVIAATNKDLAAMIREKRFREDLYYRLNVMDINIKPLRDRKEDVLVLAEYFIEENNKNHGKKVMLSEKNKEELLKYSWPGNVRELRNAIERALILTDTGELKSEHLPSGPDVMSPALLAGEGVSLEEMEKAHIIRVMGMIKGNKTQAARILGISRLTLREKIKKYGIETNIIKKTLSIFRKS